MSGSSISARSRRYGFTRSELLTALATVTLLAVAFNATYNMHARPRSERATCQANLRQIGLAIRQYVKDSDEHFPAVNGNPKKAYGWADAIQPYLKDTEFLQCPTDKTWPGKGDGPKSRTYTDYFYNANLSDQNESAIQYIAATVMLGESVPGDARQATTGIPPKGGAIYQIFNRAGAPIGAATRHLDGANYTFADGHVKWLKGSDANTCPAMTSSGCGNPTYSIS